MTGAKYQIDQQNISPKLTTCVKARKTSQLPAGSYRSLIFSELVPLSYAFPTLTASLPFPPKPNLINTVLPPIISSSPPFVPNRAGKHLSGW